MMFISPYAKINCSWITDLKVQAKIIKFLAKKKKKTQEILHRLEVGKDSLHSSQRALTIKM